jgi:hypothetical protein
MADNFKEAAASNRAASSALAGKEAGKRAAEKMNPQADKFAQNAATKPFVGGFDQMLGVQRTS